MNQNKENISIASTKSSKNNKYKIKNNKDLKFNIIEKINKKTITKNFLTLKQKKIRKKPKNIKFKLFLEDIIFKEGKELFKSRKNKKIKEDLDITTDEELIIKTEKYLFNSLKKGKKKYFKK